MQPAFGTLQKFSNPTVLYDSRDLKYKTPFGAVATAQRVSIRFPVKKSFCAETVTMILRRNEHSENYELVKSAMEDNYDIFTLNFSVDRGGTYFYRFEIKRGNNVTFVGRGYNGQALIEDWLPEWQLSVYERGYKTPDNIKGGVVYQIFCDRFCRDGGENKPPYGTVKEWKDDVTIIDPDGIYRANDFFGGNFNGIVSKLDYLSELGVTTLYLSPIFLSHSNHRYDTADYLSIDPILGSEADFKNLIKKASNKGIGIVLDGVFNHTGADSIYFNKFGHFDSVGAYQSKKSPYYDWYTFIDFPDTYKCWWGITVVPTISRDAIGFHNLITEKGGVIDKWTKMGVKGWRLDVVDELGSDFVKDIRKSIKDKDENAVVIGEVWEDASTKHSYGEEREYFRGKELDGVMNYVFKEAILEYLLSFDGEFFCDRVMTLIENYPKSSMDVCFTLIDSHDTVRAINILAGLTGEGMTKAEKRAYRLTNEQYEVGKQRLRLASAIQYFLPGVPSLYYGDEVGMEGFDDPINRRPFPWDNMDKEILEHYKYLGQLRKTYRYEFSGVPKISANGSKISIDRNGIVLTVDAITREMQVNFFDYNMKKEH